VRTGTLKTKKIIFSAIGIKKVASESGLDRKTDALIGRGNSESAKEKFEVDDYGNARRIVGRGES